MSPHCICYLVARQCSDLTCGRVDHVGLAAANQDGCTQARQRRRDALSQACAAASDECNLALEAALGQHHAQVCLKCTITSGGGVSNRDTGRVQDA